VRIYRALGDALRDGYQVYDRTHEGYVVRRRNVVNGAWEMAEVKISPGTNRLTEPHIEGD
jgi:hypothetical protein